MPRIRLFVFLLASFVPIAPLAGQGTGEVSYEISFPNAAHHEARVSVTFPGLGPGPVEVRMSRSSPGRYALHEFAKNVYEVSAEDGRGRSLEVTRPDPYGWTVAGHDGTVRFTYTLFGARMDGTYTGIDRSQAHLNAPASFAWARGLEERPIRIRFTPPQGEEWEVATQLAPTSDPLTFTAPDLYYFLDSPVHLGDLDIRSWSVETTHGPATIRLAVDHEGTAEEVDRYEEMVRRVVEEEIEIWGEAPDFEYDAYTFIATYLPWASGDGMEHRNSTILTSSSSLAQNAIGLLGTVAHEFFHAWSVERLRPRTLEPFDFERANMSRELWFAEGFTSYYDDLVLRRTGIIEDAEFARRMRGSIATVMTSPGRSFFSPVGMSMQAPFVDAAVSIDPQNRANTFISYYTWGTVVGLGLDLSIRQRFPGKSLDDYMRALWQGFGRPEIPYTVEDLERVLGEVTEPGFARDFFARYVRGSQVPDFESLFAEAGFTFRSGPSEEPRIVDGGLTFGEEGASVEEILIGSPLYNAGIARGDLILEIDGRPVSPQMFRDLSRSARPGDHLPARFRSAGREYEVELVVGRVQVVELFPLEDGGAAPTPAQRSFRAAWLGG